MNRRGPRYGFESGWLHSGYYASSLLSAHPIRALTSTDAMTQGLAHKPPQSSFRIIHQG